MPDEWVRLGSRFINLDNIVEVRVSERPPLLQIFYIGGGSVELHDDEAELLRGLLDGRTIRFETVHRRVIAPAG